MSVNHYENFPVASLLLPGKIRADVINLYRFARAADDIADEGDFSAEQRRLKLAAFSEGTCAVLNGTNARNNRRYKS